VTFSLSESATVKLAFAKAQRGHLAGRTCKSSGRGGRPCTLYTTKGVFTILGRRGLNTVAFAGKLSLSKLLSPGSYLLTATPTDSAHIVGQARTAKLAVLASGR
jgi:hypothetical protein